MCTIIEVRHVIWHVWVGTSCDSLVPRPSPKSRKRVWCSEWHFLSHGAGPYFVENVIIAFLNPELEFLMPWFAKAWDGHKVYWDSRKQAARQVSLFPIHFKITSCNYNQVFCNLIGDLKSEIGPSPCDKKCCSENQTLFARARGSGHETTAVSTSW